MQVVADGCLLHAVDEDLSVLLSGATLWAPCSAACPTCSCSAPGMVPSGYAEQHQRPGLFFLRCCSCYCLACFAAFSSSQSALIVSCSVGIASQPGCVLCAACAQCRCVCVSSSHSAAFCAERVGRSVLFLRAFDVGITSTLPSRRTVCGGGHLWATLVASAPSLGDTQCVPRRLYSCATAVQQLGSNACMSALLARSLLPVHKSSDCRMMVHLLCSHGISPFPPVMETHRL